MSEIENKKNENFYLKLAEIIYDLDTKAYVATKSSLGRHFQGSKEHNINELVKMMTDPTQRNRLRSDLAAISNMIRTIKDKEVRESLTTEYGIVMNSLKKRDAINESVEIVNEKVAGLNAANFSRKRKKNEHLIICISRSHGSAGKDIGYALADSLHINYYDTDVLRGILDSMAKEQDISWLVEKASEDPAYARAMKMAQQISKNGAEHAREFSRHHGLPKADADFFNISKFLVETAKNEDFVVVGRCADAIFANNRIPHFSIYITAPTELRARHIMQIKGISSLRKAIKEVAKRDAYHERYYHKYTGKIWGYAGNYDLCLNSSSYGIDESVEVIKRIVVEEKEQNA